MAKQFLLIANPYSGKKSGAETAQSILQQLNNQGFICEFFISKSVEQLKEFIKTQNLNNFDAVGLVGGDGTMHEFLNAVLQNSDTLVPPVALFPCGTGNAFNFDIGCSTIQQTLNCIYKNNFSYVDVAEVNFNAKTLWSFNIMGCGLVAEINKLAENMRWLGSSRYTIASLIKLLSNPVQDLVIETDSEKISGRFSFVLACNTRYTGKGMMMAPKAILHDGKFDVLIVKACSFWKLLNLFPKIFKGTHIGADVLTYIQTSELSVSSSFSGITNIDGEMKGNLPFKLKVHTGKIKVFLET